MLGYFVNRTWFYTKSDSMYIYPCIQPDAIVDKGLNKPDNQVLINKAFLN